MALARIIHSEFENKNNPEDVFKVEVFEETADPRSDVYAPAAAPGFTLTYEPEVDDLASTLCPSNVEFSFYISSEYHNVADLNQHLDRIVAAQESTFFIKIDYKKANGTVFTPYWKGVILQDQIIQEERSEPIAITLTAIDGLKLMQTDDYDYPRGSIGNYSYSALYQVIVNCLQGTKLALLFDQADVFLRVNMEFWDANQNYDSTEDSMATLGIDPTNFGTYEDGDFVYAKSFDVAKTFAQGLLCRIYMARGCFFFDQINERTTSPIRYTNYNKFGQRITSQFLNVEKIILQNNPGQWKAEGNVLGYLPAIKRATITQNLPTYGTTQVNYFVLPNNSETTELGVFARQNGEQIIIIKTQSSLYAEKNVSSSDIIAAQNNNMRGFIMNPFVYYTVEIQDINSSTIRYWNGTTWQSNSVRLPKRGPAEAIIAAGLITYNNGFQVTETLGPLPFDATVKLTVELEWKQQTGPSTFVNTNVSKERGYVDTDLKVTRERTTNVERFGVTNQNANIAETEILDLGETGIGDGTLFTGGIIVVKNGNLFSAGQWGVKTNSGNTRLLNLMLQERVRLQDTPILKYEGEIQYIEGFQYAINDGDNFYLPLSYSFTAFYGLVNAEYFKIREGDIPTIDPVFQGGVQNDLIGEDMAGLGKNSGPIVNKYQLGPFSILQDSTQATEPLTTNQFGSRYKVNDVNGGGSVNIDQTLRTHIINQTSAGSVTVNLPLIAESDKLSYIIIAGSSIDEMVLTGDALINGQNELVTNVPYTQIEVWGLNSEWYARVI